MLEVFYVIHNLTRFHLGHRKTLFDDIFFLVQLPTLHYICITRERVSIKNISFCYILQQIDNTNRKQYIVLSYDNTNSYML